jgi:hypothetical protein
LREEAAKALAVEETALAALAGTRHHSRHSLAPASGKAVKWRRLQAALKYEIDTLYLGLAEAKDVGGSSQRPVGARSSVNNCGRGMDDTTMEPQDAPLQKKSKKKIRAF